MAFKKDARRNWFAHSDWNWQDALYGGMILTSVAGLIYAFIRK
jgi:hypothetical protein